MSSVPPTSRRRAGRLGVAVLALLALSGAGRDASAQAVLFGRITDAGGDAVAEVVVTARGPDGAPAARTSATGEYEISGLVPGRYRVEAARVGYRTVAREVQLAGAARRRLDFSLREETVVLEGLVVEGRGGDDSERARFETEPGVTARVISGASLKTLPGLAEADVLRAMEVLPGVISTSDFSSAFNVRGGSADQNLILLDGFTVFNPFHLGGLFSVFNSDAIARAELLAGGFGAEYGARVSSVLNVETEGTVDSLEVHGGVSVLAARVLVRGPIPRALTGAVGAPRGSWMVSARRSYFDQLMRPVVDFPYHLTDLQGYAEVGLAGGGRVSLTAYSGDDVLDLSDFEPPGEEDDSTSILRLQWKWGNRVVGTRWVQPVGRSWVADTRLGYSAFSDQLGFVDFQGIRFGSSVGQISLKTDLTRERGATTVKLGAGVDGLRYDNFAEAGGTEFFASSDDGYLASTFATVRWRPTDAWIVEPGVRAELWHGSSGSRALVSPRFAVKRFFGDSRTLAAKLAVGRYTQFLHSLRNEEFPVSNDTWILASDATPVVVSDQLQAGVEKYWGDDWYASVEGYLRRFDGVTELNLADNPNDPDDDFLAGEGRSVGLDLFLRRESGRLTGWAAVSLLRAERTLPDALAAGWDDLSPTRTFPPIFDRRVDVDLVLQYALPRGWDLGVRWNYGSPIPYTRPVSQYFGFDYSVLRGQYEPMTGPGEGTSIYVALGDRNGERYPPYHRLDATIRRTFERSWGRWTPYLQVLNVYNRRNVLFYFYNYDRLEPTRSGISMFPVLPALGVELSF